MKYQQLGGKKISLHIFNTSRNKKSFNPNKLQAYLKLLVPHLEDLLWSKTLLNKKSQVQQVQLTMTICGKAKIKSLNSQFRNKNKVTDVLSFGLYEDLRVEGKGPYLPEVLELGDIFICKEVAKSQAREFNISIEEEILHLFIHGLLHLCGFDHEISLAEEKMMESFEKKLLRKVASDKKAKNK